MSPGSITSLCLLKGRGQSPAEILGAAPSSFHPSLNASNSVYEEQKACDRLGATASCLLPLRNSSLGIYCYINRMWDWDGVRAVNGRHLHSPELGNAPAPLTAQRVS